MASKTKKKKATKESLPLSIMFSFANVIGNQEYLPEPPNYE